MYDIYDIFTAQSCNIGRDLLLGIHSNPFADIHFVTTLILIWWPADTYQKQRKYELAEYLHVESIEEEAEKVR